MKKLVRDGIPIKILNDPDGPATLTIGVDRTLGWLIKKLKEEFAELIANLEKCPETGYASDDVRKLVIEESADFFDVHDAIIGHLGIIRYQIVEACQDKTKKVGGFSGRIIVDFPDQVTTLIPEAARPNGLNIDWLTKPLADACISSKIYIEKPISYDSPIPGFNFEANLSSDRNKTIQIIHAAATEGEKLGFHMKYVTISGYDFSCYFTIDSPT